MRTAQEIHERVTAAAVMQAQDEWQAAYQSGFMAALEWVLNE